MKNWTSTVCFRRFRKKHTELSRIYWTHVLGSDVLSFQIAGKNASEYVVDVTPASFKRGMLPVKVGEMQDWLPEYLGRVRLHLLLVCAANLESYLQETCLNFLLGKGYRKTNTTLNAVGEAMGRPILGHQSLPDPLKYAEELFQVKYGHPLVVWKRSYKIRCALAHNGGVITARTLREIPDIGLPLHSPIGLTWAQLFDSLRAADDLATETDRKISNSEVRQAETIKELQHLKESKKLPHKKNVWRYLHEHLSVAREGKAFQTNVEKAIYSGTP